MNLGELVVQLGVKADTFTVKDFARTIEQIPLSAASAIVSLAGLSYGFVEVTKNVLGMTSGFQLFTAQTDLNVRSLQQWQMVAQRAGISGEIVQSSIMSLSSMMARMRLGYGLPPDAARAFGMLGIGPESYKLSATDLLSKIQEGTQGKPAAQSAELLKMLGVSPEMLRLFQTSQSEREGLTPQMSASDISQMADFQKELANFNNTTMREFTKVLVEFEPYMADLTKALGWIILHAGGWVGKGIGEDARLMNEVTKYGFGETLLNILRSYQTPGMIGAGTINQTINQNIHSTADPMTIADEAERLSRRSLRKAAADIGNQGQ